MASGWIKIDRGILNHWVYQDMRYFQWWFDLIINANWVDGECKDDGHTFVLKRGQLCASVSFLANRWKLTESTTLRFLKRLEADGMINREVKFRKTAIITICNYDKYQGEEVKTLTEGLTEGLTKTLMETLNTDSSEVIDTLVKTLTKTQAKTLTKTIAEVNKRIKEIEENNKEKEKEKEKPKIFQPPSIEEVRQYCEERNNGIDAEAFVAFYESKGWMIGKNKMKNWKSAIVTWEKKRKNETQIVTLTPSQHGQYISTDDRRAEEKAKRIASGIALVNATLASNTPYEE